MLILSRKTGERFLVPHLDLSVTVQSVKGKTVRLGIEAPPNVAIVCAESGRSNTNVSMQTDEQSVGSK